MMKSKNKIISFFVLLLIVSLLLCSCSKTQRGIENYEKDRETLNMYAPNFLPALDSIGDYKNAEYTRKVSNDLMFVWEGYTLIVSYNQDVYESEIERISSSDLFLNEENAKLYKKLPLAEFEYKGYKMHIVPLIEGINSCKYFGLIGFNDETTTICYLMYCDSDIDTLDISDDPVKGYCDFLDDNFELD